jgi:DNA-binding MarR family transcriptional regulator
MARKIFEQQIVDRTTGEVFTTTTVKVDRDIETYGMHRTTEGLDWVFDFTAAEFQMMMILSNLENPKSNIIQFTELSRKHLAEKFKATRRHISRIIHQLVDKDVLVKLTTDDYFMNPLYFYCGGTKSWKGRTERYQLYKKQMLDKTGDDNGK